MIVARQAGFTIFAQMVDQGDRAGKYQNRDGGQTVSAKICGPLHHCVISRQCRAQQVPRKSGKEPTPEPFRYSECEGKRENAMDTGSPDQACGTGCEREIDGQARG